MVPIYKGVLGKNLENIIPSIIKNFEMIALLEGGNHEYPSTGG